MLGTRIAALRRQRNLSQGELAGMLNISPSTIGMYEQGRREPSLETAAELARVLDVSLDYLITGAPTEQERHGLEAFLSDRIDTARHRLAQRSDSPLTQQELVVLFTAMLLEG